MAVASVLVTEPGDVLELVHHEPCGTMGEVVIRVRETERYEHRGGFEMSEGSGQCRCDVSGLVPVGLLQVLVVAESSQCGVAPSSASAATSSPRRNDTMSSSAVNPPSASHSLGVAGTRVAGRRKR